MKCTEMFGMMYARLADAAAPPLRWAILIVLVLVGSHRADANVLAGWDTNGLQNVANFGPSPWSPTDSDPSVTVGGWTRGSGLTTSGSGAFNAWGGNGFTVGSASSAQADGDGDYGSFTIQANPGQVLSLDSIDAYNIRRSGTGPTTGQWEYSTDGSTFTNIGDPITWGSTTSSAGNAQSAISLSGISDLQNVPATITITFRVANWGGSNSAGTWYINTITNPTSPGDDFTISGTVSGGSQLLAGDYNNDGVVDAADYVTWRTSFDTFTPLPANETASPGFTDQEDFDVWRANFGNTLVVGGGAGLATHGVAVPEPSPLILLLTLVAGAGCPIRWCRTRIVRHYAT
jgi:hypothetical protein